MTQRKHIKGQGNKLFFTDGRASLAARVWFFTQMRALTDAEFKDAILEWSCRYRAEDYFTIKGATVRIDRTDRTERTYAAMEEEITAAIQKSLPRKLHEKKFVVLTKRDKDKIAYREHVKQLHEDWDRKVKEAAERGETLVFPVDEREVNVVKVPRIRPGEVRKAMLAKKAAEKEAANRKAAEEMGISYEEYCEKYVQEEEDYV